MVYSEDFEQEKALPEARIYKRNIMEILFSMLDHFRHYRLGGKSYKKELSDACNDLLFLYEIMEPKIIRTSEKKGKERFKELTEVGKYVTSVEVMIKLPRSKIMKFKSLMVDFIEELGITKIEITEVDPRKAVLEGMF